MNPRTPRVFAPLTSTGILSYWAVMITLGWLIGWTLGS